jgi:hypothetical protein
MSQEGGLVFRSQLPPNWMGQTTARERSNLTGSSSEPRAFRFGLKWILSEIANRRSSGRILFPAAPMKVRQKVSP